MTGKVRSRNEDSFLYTDEKDWPNQLAIVADGIGGNLHGEIASRLCCQYFYEIFYFFRLKKSIMKSFFVLKS